MDADCRVGSTRPARDEADTGAACELAIGVGHVGGAAFLAADDEFEFIFNVVHRIQHGEIRFTGHAEGGVRAVRDQCIDQ